MNSSDAEAMVRRAARTIAVQIALAVGLVVIAVAAAVFVVEEHQQQAQARATARSAWASADDVDDPPVGVWLVAVDDTGRRKSTPRAPGVVGDVDPAALPDGAGRVGREGRAFVVWTGQRGELGRVSAVVDLGPMELAAHRMLAGLGVAALVGAAGAALVGMVIGRRAVRPLGEAISLQRRFVADASHELRTPITILMTRAQLLRRHLPATLPAERSAEVDRLVEDARNLGEVVNDLLVSAELQHRPQRAEPVDPIALAEEVVRSLGPIAHQRGIALAVDVGAEVGAEGRSAEDHALGLCRVNGAPVALRRALTSLVDNALAHTPRGGHVRVVIARTGGEVGLAVLDDGEGLDAERTEHLLARFGRGTDDQAGARFGLGLALVAEIARAHGGTLTIEGEPGHGACFTLRLPAASKKPPRTRSDTG